MAYLPLGRFCIKHGYLGLLKWRLWRRSCFTSWRWGCWLRLGPNGRGFALDRRGMLFSEREGFARAWAFHGWVLKLLPAAGPSQLARWMERHRGRPGLRGRLVEKADVRFLRREVKKARRR